jgi:hypothetical protein
MTRASWVVLLFCAALVGASAGQVAFRALQPTDGWLVHGGPFGTPDGMRLIYDLALTTESTPLQEGDRVFAVEGYPVDPLRLDLGLGETVALARWRADLPLRYSLLRNGETLVVAVAPTDWDFSAWLRYMTLDLDRAANTFAVLILACVALLVFARRNNHASSRTLLLLSAALLAQWLSGSLPDGISVILHPPVRALTLFFTYSIFFAVIAPTVLVFALVFPQSRPWVEHKPWLLVLIYLPPILVMWAIVATHRAELGWLCALAYVLLSMGALARSLVHAHDPVSRAQLHWAGLGFIVGLALTLLTYLSIFGLVGEPWDSLFRAGSSAGLVVVGVAMAIAVLRYRLFDIELIIRRTLVYTVVTASMVSLYLASVIVLQNAFVSLTGQRSQAAVALSTLAIAALFSPFRVRVQDWIDRRFYRSQYDADRIVAAFARIAQNEADLNLITDEMMTVIRETMQPTFAGFWLRKADDEHVERRAYYAARWE